MASGRAEDMPEGDRGGCGLWLSATVCWVATLVGGAELAGRLSAQRSRHLPKINSGSYNFLETVRDFNRGPLPSTCHNSPMTRRTDQ